MSRNTRCLRTLRRADSRYSNCSDLACRTLFSFAALHRDTRFGLHRLSLANHLSTAGSQSRWNSIGRAQRWGASLTNIGK